MERRLVACLQDFKIDPGGQVPRSPGLWGEFVAVLDGQVEAFIGVEPWHIRSGLGLWIPERTRPWLESAGGASVRVLSLSRSRYPVFHLIEFSPTWMELMERVRFPGMMYGTDDELALLRVAGQDLDASWSLALSPPRPKGWLEAKAADMLPNPEFTLDQIAAECEMSVRSLDKRLRRQTGYGMKAWRKELRLIESVRLLFAGVGIDEIAKRTGYSSRPAFIVAFRYRFAFTPKQFRRMRGPVSLPLRK